MLAEMFSGSTGTTTAGFPAIFVASASARIVAAISGVTGSVGLSITRTPRSTSAPRPAANTSRSGASAPQSAFE